MADPVQTHGMFSWFELVAEDVEEAKAFYGPLLGWTFETNSDAGMEYTLARVEGVPHPVAGMFGKQHLMVENKEQIPPHWGSYITVDDVDAVVKKVSGLGGSVIVPPTDIPDVGRFSVIQDPQGAVVSLMTYAYAPMA